MLATNSFLSLAYVGGVIFFLLVVLKLTVPYSNGLLKQLHLWSKKIFVQIILFVASLLWTLLVLYWHNVLILETANILDLIIQCAVCLLIIIVTWGVLIAFMRFSFVYLVKEEK